ncbi:MAG: GNAT family N-acetyltransferase [Candidatus Nealsonbacteria bacterium]
MESKFLKIEDKDKWLALLDRALFKSFFHSLEWEEFLESQFKWLKFERYLWEDQTVLSLARAKIGNSEKLVSHPFCEYGGPLPLTSQINGKDFKVDFLNKFKNARISFHPKILEYFNLDEADKALFKNQRSAFWIEDLNQQSKEEVWSSFKKTLKHSISQAEERDIRVRKCEDEKELDSFYSLYVVSAKMHKIPPYPLSFFKFFLQSDKSEIVLAEYKNKIVAGSVFLFYDKFIHYFINASDYNYRNLGANYLIIWRQIERFCQKDYKVFDFGGTRKNSSLEIFKRGWGGKEYPIFELTGSTDSSSSFGLLRNVFGLLPLFLIKRISSYLLKYKI